MQGIIDKGGYVVVPEEGGKELADDVEGESVHAKDVEEAGVSRLARAIVDKEHDEGLHGSSKSAGDEGKGGTPYALVQGESITEQIASEGANGAYGKEVGHLLLDALLGLDKSTAIEADECVSRA